MSAHHYNRKVYTVNSFEVDVRLDMCEGVPDLTNTSITHRDNSDDAPLRMCWKNSISSTGSTPLVHMDLNPTSSDKRGVTSGQSNVRVVIALQPNITTIFEGHVFILGPWNVKETSGNIRRTTDGHSIEVQSSGYYHVYSQVTVSPSSRSRRIPVPVAMTVRVCREPGVAIAHSTCHWYRSTSASRSTLADHPVTLYVGYLTKALQRDLMSVALSSDFDVVVSTRDTFFGAFQVSKMNE